MKPPIPYFGGKINIAEQIIALMPPHRGYIEPYAGSLSILLAKAPAKVEVVNDLNHDLVTFWRVLRDRPAELAAAAELTPHSRAETEISYDRAGLDDLEIARRVWVSLTQGRSRTGRRGGWRHYLDPRGSSSPFAQYMDAYRSRLLPAAERIRNVALECRPALEVITKYGQFEENLLYVDPPYVVSSRSSAYGSRYTEEMDDDDHRAMAAALHECKASVMLSGYAGELYEELFDGWTRVPIRAFSGNSVNSEKTEVLWMNYTTAHQLDFSELIAGGHG